MSKHNTFDFEDNDSIDNIANVAWEESILLTFACLRLVRCRREQAKKKQSVIRKVGKQGLVVYYRYLQGFVVQKRYYLSCDRFYLLEQNGLSII
ncbi:MAG: hypothetical protein ACFNUM_02735, partial [Segatella salivae]